MGQDPRAIREEIEDTRERMGDTVDALAYKADVPGRARDRVSGAVGSVKEKVGGAGSTVSDRTPDGAQVKRGAKQAVGTAEANPLGLAIGFAAAGFIGGLLAPRTRVEDEKLGPMADQVKEQASQTASEALDRGKQVAQEAAGTAKEQAQQAVQEVKETTQQSAQEHGSELKDSAQENAQSVSRP